MRMRMRMELKRVYHRLGNFFWVKKEKKKKLKLRKVLRLKKMEDILDRRVVSLVLLLLLSFDLQAMSFREL